MALFPWLSGRSAANATKRAGTTLADMAMREAENAGAVPGVINPALSEAYLRAQQAYSPVANRSADDLMAMARQGQEGMTNAVTGANEALNPYMAAGGESLSTLSQLANAPEAQFNFQFSQDDPSYQWRLQQGQEALQKSAAMRGGLQGGGTLKALTNYAQGAASQEYQNAFNRSLSTFNANQQSRQQRLNTLSNLAGLGYSAAGRAGSNLIGGAEYGGTLGYNAASRGGDWRNQAALQEGEWGIGSARDQSNVAMKYGDMARQIRMGGAQATAASQMGTGNVWGNFWDN